MDEFKEKAELIEKILDKMIPFPKNAPEEIKEKIDSDRQMLIIRAGFNLLSVEELKRKLGEEKCQRKKKREKVYEKCLILSHPEKEKS